MRDASTGIGKGFGYVNFVAIESVELALRMANQEVEDLFLKVWIRLLSILQGDFFNWASPENFSRLAPPKFAWSGPPLNFLSV